MLKKNIQNKVQVWLYCFQASNPLFLTLKTQPQRGSFWQPVTGSVETSESLQEAAYREVLEETGLQVSHLFPIGEPFEFYARGLIFREYSFASNIALQQNQCPQIHLDPHEHIDFQWAISELTLQKLYYDSHIKMLNYLLLKLESKI